MGCSRNIKKCSNEGDKLLILYGVEGYRYRWTGKERVWRVPLVLVVCCGSQSIIFWHPTTLKSTCWRTLRTSLCDERNSDVHIYTEIPTRFQSFRRVRGGGTFVLVDGVVLP